MKSSKLTLAREARWSGVGAPYVLAVLRVCYGLLWLQQTTWKVPPDFGMRSGSGLYYWTTEMTKYSFFSPHRFFVEYVVLPHFLLFAWLTLCVEWFIGFSHLLGAFSRLGALVAAAMCMNLLVGLARQPTVWPWSYLMLLGYALLFLGTHPGRVLGLDGPLSRRLEAPALARRPWAKALALMT